MAVTDRYATASEYRARVGKTDTGDDLTVIEPLLDAVTDLLRRECGRFFTQDASAVLRLYDGKGGTRLYVDDIASLTGLVVKVDLDEDYAFTGSDETLTKDTHFWVGPENVDLGPEPEPWRFLEIVPDNGVLSVWPDQRRAVQVTAIFGWPAVPPAVKEATVMVTREMRDLELAGFVLELQNIDQAVNLSRTAMSIIERIKAKYGNALVVL